MALDFSRNLILAKFNENKMVRCKCEPSGNKLASTKVHFGDVGLGELRQIKCQICSRRQNLTK